MEAARRTLRAVFLWSLGALYRVGSIVGLALVLLLMSFVTQRFILKKSQA